MGSDMVLEGIGELVITCQRCGGGLSFEDFDCCVHHYAIFSSCPHCGDTGSSHCPECDAQDISC